MKPFAYIVLFLFSAMSLHAQEHCVSNPSFRSTELFPGPSTNLVNTDYIVIETDSIEFDKVKYKISEATFFPFDSKDDLLRSFSCIYSFLSASENISGELIKYKMNQEIPRIGNEFQFIHFNDCGTEEQYVYVDDGLYYFRNNPSFLSQDVVLLLERSIVIDTYDFAHSVDPNASVIYLEEPLFEYVTEQVLEKTAYTELEIVEPEYIENYNYTLNELSDCPNVIYDTIYEQLLVKEGSLHFEITPAQIEVVSELVAKQNKYNGENIYERELIDSVIIQLRSPFIEMEDYEIDPGCLETDFYDCIRFDFVLNEGKDSTFYNVYEKCADGFNTAGKYCYSNDGTVPYVFEERQYSKLIIDASAETTMIPNEYMTVSSIRILNKDELDPSCVETVYDTIPYLKLITDASLNAINVPAEYTTRIYTYYQDGGIIDVVNEGDQEQIARIPMIGGGSMELEDFSSAVVQSYSPCYLPAIRDRLVELGYLEEADKNDTSAFQEAVLKYQIEYHLPLGVIDHFLIDYLDVKLGF